MNAKNGHAKEYRILLWRVSKLDDIRYRIVS